MPTANAANPRKQPRQRRAQATVDAILQATAHILIEHGYEGASTNRIAKRAGVSIGSLYQYFPNKTALVLAVANRHADQMLNLLAQTAIDLADAPIEQAVRSYVRAMVEAHAVEPELHRVLAAHALQSGFEHIVEIDRRARRIVRTYLELRKDELIVGDIETAAFVLVTSVDAIIHAHPLYEPDGIAFSALEEEITALVLRYLTGKG